MKDTENTWVRNFPGGSQSDPTLATGPSETYRLDSVLMSLKRLSRKLVKGAADPSESGWSTSSLEHLR